MCIDRVASHYSQKPAFRHTDWFQGSKQHWADIFNTATLHVGHIRYQYTGMQLTMLYQSYRVYLQPPSTHKASTADRLRLTYLQALAASPSRHKHAEVAGQAGSPAAAHSSRGGPCVGSSLKRFLHSTRSRENLSSGEKRAGCALCVGRAVRRLLLRAAGAASSSRSSHCCTDRCHTCVCLLERCRSLCVGVPSGASFCARQGLRAQAEAVAAVSADRHSCVLAQTAKGLCMYVPPCWPQPERQALGKEVPQPLCALCLVLSANAAEERALHCLLRAADTSGELKHWYSS